MTQTDITEIQKNHTKWLRDTSKGARANLRRANLRHADLRDADLRGADLRAADLHGADLRDANLHYADLRDANLRAANLRDADLRGADLDFAAWPLCCGSLDVKLDERLQAQLLYHVLAVSPVARKLATPEMLAFANGSHVVRSHGKPELTASQPEARP